MGVIKVIHVICVLVWVGQLMTLSRLMACHAKEEREATESEVTLCSRLYYFAQMPAMLIGVTTGLILIGGVDLSFKPGWFHMKLMFIFLMIGVDLLMGRMVARLGRGAGFGPAAKYKMIHGMAGLALIGVAVSLYVVRDRDGEVLHRAAKIERVSSKFNQIMGD